MKLWTFHPSDFPLDDPSQPIIHERGTYWDCPTTPRYKTAIRKLHELVDNDQVLWCYTVRDTHIHFHEIDEIEWELNIPFCQIQAFYSVSIWDGILHGRRDDWDNLVLHGMTPQNAVREDVGALVRWPLNPCCVKRLGTPPPKYPPQISG